jgi:glucose-1-phosphate cytidylyltransferase
MQAVILAGGRGNRLAEESQVIPKSLVRIGSRPIVHHIMDHYSAYGINDFVLALGYRGHQVKEYFADLARNRSDIRVDVSTGRVETLTSADLPWRVTLVDTGTETRTGGRIRRVAPYLHDTFMVTYEDGLSDVDLTELLEFHRSSDCLATVTAVRPPPRFGTLRIHAGKVTAFREKMPSTSAWINGGYLVLEPASIKHIPSDTSSLESDVLPALAESAELAAYEHEGFWHPLDTVPDRDHLIELWESGKAPWGRTR